MARPRSFLASGELNQKTGSVSGKEQPVRDLDLGRHHHPAVLDGGLCAGAAEIQVFMQALYE